MSKMKKFWLIFAVIIIAVGAAAFYFRFYYVFGEGVKSGELNYVVYKGVIFKTYEGKLIQSGFRSPKGTSSIQSYEFEFSVEKPELAEELMLQGGNTLKLHYKEYFGALPWRGFTKFVVDSIISERVEPVQQVQSPADSGSAADGSRAKERPLFDEDELQFD